MKKINILCTFIFLILCLNAFADDSTYKLNHELSNSAVKKDPKKIYHDNWRKDYTPPKVEIKSYTKFFVCGAQFGFDQTQACSDLILKNIEKVSDNKKYICNEMKLGNCDSITYQELIKANNDVHFHSSCAKALSKNDYSGNNDLEIRKCSNIVSLTIAKAHIEIKPNTEYDFLGSTGAFKSPIAAQTSINSFIAPTVSSMTIEQKDNLAKCIMQNKASDEKMLECVNTNLKEGIDDQEYLSQLREKYCTYRNDSTGKTTELSESEQEKCLSMLIAANINSLPESLFQECLALEGSERAKCRRDIALKHLTAKHVLPVEDCFNLEKYPTMDKQIECRERARKVAKEVYRCEKISNTAQQISCFEAIDDSEFADNYFARKMGIHFGRCEEQKPTLLLNGETFPCNKSALAQCETLPEHERRKCFFNILDGQLISQLNDSNKQCLGQSQAAQCFKLNYNTPVPASPNLADAGGATTEGTTDTTGTNGANQTTGNTTGNTGTTTNRGAVVGTVSAVGATTVLATTTNSARSSNGTIVVNSNGPQSLGTGNGGAAPAGNTSSIADEMRQRCAFSFFKDWKYMSLRDQNPSSGSNLCKKLRRAAIIRVAGTIGSIAAVTAGGIAGAKILSKKDDDGKQKKAMKGTIAILGGLAGGLGIKIATHAISNNIIKNAIAEERTYQLNSPVPVQTVCVPKKELKKQSMYFYQSEKEKQLKYKYSKATIEQINHANSIEQLNAIYSEWEDYSFNNDNKTSVELIATNNESLPLTIDEHKSFLVSTIETMSDLFISKAYADDEDDDDEEEEKKFDATQLMPLATMAMTMIPAKAQEATDSPAPGEAMAVDRTTEIDQETVHDQNQLEQVQGNLAATEGLLKSSTEGNE